MGRRAAHEALSRLKQFEPSLALVFVSAELDVEEVNRGASEVLNGCPTIGTSTAGEIYNGSSSNGVVVVVIAGRHLRVRVGMGHNVGADYREAIRQALGQADVLDYFDSGHPFHHTMAISSPGIPGVSSAFMIAFSPGATKRQPSLSHDIHTYLRRYSANRIPIFGGSSGDNLRFESNRQIVNGVSACDSVAVAFVESQILFGLGLAHGFSPTTKGALVTNASDHIVHELDGRPAAEVLAEILGMPLEQLGTQTVWFSRFPFGSTDVYGNSIIQVPERVLDDGSVQFGPLMKPHQVITLMNGTESEIAQAGLTAYKKAVRQAGLRKPALALMCSCALRKRLMASEQQEIDPIRQYTSVPLCGFYTFGEKGLSDDGLPVYCNQSVSMLVFSDELNPVASLVSKGTSAYEEFSGRLRRKEDQLNAVARVNRVIQASSGRTQLLRLLVDELAEILPWTDVAFYLPEDSSVRRRLSCASSQQEFPEIVTNPEALHEFIPIPLEYAGRSLGLMVLKVRWDTSPEEDDFDTVNTLAQIAAGGLYRLELDGRLDLKLRHLEISNQLGKELAKAVGSVSPTQHMLAHLRRVLNLTSGTLWLIDESSRILVKEAFDSEPGRGPDLLVAANDEIIAKWQARNSQALHWSPSEGTCAIGLIVPFPFSFVTIPVQYKGKVRGILNLYSAGRHEGLLAPEQVRETLDLLTNLSAQIAVFLENLSLQKHSTLYREVNHRIKNNLHNIAGLLRMQSRRLDKVPPEQALDDSIARIISIAKVHETLSQGDLGMIDLGRLAGRIGTLSATDAPKSPVVSIDVSGSRILAPSKEATSVALIVNELVRNAVQHGRSLTGDCKVSIRLTLAEGLVSLSVEDDGPGLPKGFDPKRDGNLGLSIVSALAVEELKGTFAIGGSRGSKAEVRFPLPTGHRI